MINNNKTAGRFIRIRQQTLCWRALYMIESVCGGHHPDRVIYKDRARKEPCLFENGRRLRRREA